jgi:adenylate kinase
MNIAILGAPASGKGTQAEIIARKFGLYHLQAGAIARELAKKDKRIKKIVESGKMIPQQEMTMYIINVLKEKMPVMKNILFEGFPRFISQYKSLERFLKNAGGGIDKIFSLDIDEDTAVKRISSRLMCENCERTYNLITAPSLKEGVCDTCGRKLTRRKDDEPEAVRRRFRDYYKSTHKLIEYLDKNGKLTRIRADRPIDEISREIISIIQSS